MDRDEIDEFRREEQKARCYRIELSRAPDCRDPDHPGCQYCEDEDDE